jgi:transcriptional/translational regulatory protein YebC/TACO1
MAGHSHWAGIKHKKGRADKAEVQRYFQNSQEKLLLLRN